MVFPIFLLDRPQSSLSFWTDYVTGSWSSVWSIDSPGMGSIHDDFLLFRPPATLVQMIALVVAGWALYAMFTDQPMVALTRFSLACFAQLGMISFMLADRRR